MLKPLPSITKEQCTSKGKELTQTFLAVDADFKSVYFWRERDRPLACKFPGQSGKPVRIADFEENTQRGGERPELPRKKKI